MRRFLRPRNLVLAGLGVSLLFTGVVIGGWMYAEARIEEALVSRAEGVGWTLEIDDIDLSFGGDVVVSGLRAEGPHGGHVSVERLETRLTPSEAWHGKRVPDHVDIFHVEGWISREGIDAIRTARGAGAGDAGETDRGRSRVPTVHVHGGSIAVATRTDLGAVGVEQLDVFIEKGAADDQDDGASRWSLEGQASLVLDARHPVEFDVRAEPDRGWAQVSAEFATPVYVYRPGLGHVAISSIDVEGSPQQLTGDLVGVYLEPERKIGVTSIEVARLEFSASRGEGAWWPDDVTVVEPRVILDLEAVLNGPIGRRHPRLQAAAEAVRLRLFPDAAPLIRPIRGIARRGQVIRTTAAAGGRSGVDIPDVQLGALIDELPGVLVEDGAIELVAWGGRRLSVQGLSFDTTGLAGAGDRAAGASREYSLELGVRGATARAKLVLPPSAAASGAGRHAVAAAPATDPQRPALDAAGERQDDDQTPQTPHASISIEGLSAEDLFAVADVPPPRALAGELDLDVDVRRSPAGEIVVSGGVAVRDLGFYHRMVSTEPLRHVDGRVHGELRFDPVADHLKLTLDEIRSGPLSVAAEVEIAELRTDPFVELRVHAEELECEAIPDAIPEGMLPTIDDLRIAPGTMSPRIEASVRWHEPMSWKMRATGIPGECRPLSVAPHDVLALNEDDYTHTYREMPYTSLEDGITVGPGSHDWVELDDLPGYVPAAMVLTEDKRFFDHSGLRIGLINRAVRLDLEGGRYVYGGSTISQQLVKNLFLKRTKAMARKLEEVLIVWMMEWEVPKARILELYVNCIEFGPDIYGVEQGARFYFDVPARELTPLQAGYLASLKVAPRRGGKFYIRGLPGPGRWWNKRQRYIQVVLAENGYISPAEVLAAWPYDPQFDHPDPDDPSDPRHDWMRRWAEHWR